MTGHFFAITQCMKVLKQPILRQDIPETFCQSSETTCLDQKETTRSQFVCRYCLSPCANRDSEFCCSSCELLFNWTQDGLNPQQKADVVPEKWRNFSHPELESTFNLSKNDDLKRFRFFIEGLRCSSCVNLLEEFPRYCAAVKSARVHFSESTLSVDCEKKMSLGELCHLIEQLGYKPTPIKEPSDIEHARLKDFRADLMRIGVAGAIAGNEMLFSTPIYVGLAGTLGLLFKWISFVIFVPLLFYVATPFYQRAWASLKLRRVNVDMMIVVALWAGFIFSTFSLIQQNDEIYFDSTASFIFLIITTRFLLKRQQDRLTGQNLFADLFAQELYEIQGSTGASYLSYDHIQKGQTFRMKRGQLIPCDSLLMSTQADFDLAFLTGEPYPEVRHQNNLILAGSRLLSSQAEFKCEIAALQSQLSISLNRLSEEHRQKNKIQSLSDVISHRLTVVVFSVALLYFLLTFSELGIESFKRCLALITIACPCAVAFGTPLAHALGLKKAARFGYYIKSEDIFERLTHVDKIVFDKTGTLTSAQLDFVKTVPFEISNHFRSIILGLEKSSQHPVATSLKHKWSDCSVIDFPLVHEATGTGVEGFLDGHFYEFKKSLHPDNSGSLKVDFLVDSKLECSVFFNEKVRLESSEVVKALKADGFSVFMLTGDQAHRAQMMARQTAIEGSNVFADQTSLSKKLFVEKQNPCLYVGDGLNDLEALNAAYVSFAIKGTFESTLHISDVYAPQKDLKALRELFGLAAQINKTVKWNLIFALFYNAIAGTCALLGLINPLVAAVLMPLSSLLIFTHTTWRLK